MKSDRWRVSGFGIEGWYFQNETAAGHGHQLPVEMLLPLRTFGLSHHLRQSFIGPTDIFYPELRLRSYSCLVTNERDFPLTRHPGY